MSLGQRSRSQSALKTLCIDFSETCLCQTITLLGMVGFENNLAQMITMIR